MDPATEFGGERDREVGNDLAQHHQPDIGDGEDLRVGLTVDREDVSGGLEARDVVGIARWRRSPRTGVG